METTIKFSDQGNSHTEKNILCCERSKARNHVITRNEKHMRFTRAFAELLTGVYELK